MLLSICAWHCVQKQLNGQFLTFFYVVPLMQHNFLKSNKTKKTVGVLLAQTFTSQKYPFVYKLRWGNASQKQDGTKQVVRQEIISLSKGSFTRDMWV
jgi:hypothetical protein